MRGKGANGVVGSGVLFEVEERHCPDGHVINYANAHQTREQAIGVTLRDARINKQSARAQIVSKFIDTNAQLNSGVLFEVEERHCPDGHVIIIEIGAQRSALVLVAASDEHTDDLGKLCELRAKKGMTPDVARKTLRDPNYFGTMLVVLGQADGLVSGAISSTANRPDRHPGPCRSREWSRRACPHAVRSRTPWRSGRTAPRCQRAAPGVVRHLFVANGEYPVLLESRNSGEHKTPMEDAQNGKNRPCYQFRLQLDQVPACRP